MIFFLDNWFHLQKLFRVLFKKRQKETKQLLIFQISHFKAESWKSWLIFLLKHSVSANFLSVSFAYPFF